MLSQMMKQLKRLHRDEQGAEGLEKLLIIAAVILPLLGLLIWFRDEIGAWVTEIWERARGTADNNMDGFFDSGDIQ
jgi:Flp pilus assembly pilin Flp